MMAMTGSDPEMGTIIIGSLEHTRKTLPEQPGDRTDLSGRIFMTILPAIDGHSGYVQPHVMDWKV
jgi:hypothetical protein